MIEGPIREDITEHGQVYQDKPREFANPKPERTSLIAQSVTRLFGGRVPERFTHSWTRHPLRWKKP